MSISNQKLGMCVLRSALGIAILIEAILFLLPLGAHSFARTHLPGIVRWILGAGEIVGCVLVLIPQTVARGAWLLVTVFGVAIFIHLLHGMYGVSNLVIYAAAAFAIAMEK